MFRSVGPVVRRSLIAVAAMSVAVSAGAAVHIGTTGSDVRGRPGARVASGRPVVDVETAAIAKAIELNALPTRDGDYDDPARYCDSENLAVLWTKPDGSYKRGAYVEPLGPEPGPTATSVNGVVVCAGSLYAYMGFEASRSDDGWQIIPVPEVGHEDAAGLNDIEEVLDLDDKPAAAKKSSGSGAAAAVGPVGKGLTSPKASMFTAAIEPFSAYQPQSTCSPTPKAGVLAWRTKLLKAFPGSRNLGVSRGCSIGGLSEHKEGRAFDWGVNVNNPSERAKAQRVIDFLFAKDEWGNSHAMARRLGLMYIVWNRQIWGSYRSGQGWRPYSGASAHTDHIHFSFAWAGAKRQTSFWTGKVADMPGASGGGAGGWNNVSYKNSGSSSGGGHDHGDGDRDGWKQRADDWRDHADEKRDEWRQRAEEAREEWWKRVLAEREAREDRDDDDDHDHDAWKQVSEEQREEWKERAEQKRAEWEAAREEWLARREAERNEWEAKREAAREEWEAKRDEALEQWRSRDRDGSGDRRQRRDGGRRRSWRHR